MADLRWLLRAERQRVSELESLLKRAGTKIKKLTKQVIGPDRPETLILDCTNPDSELGTLDFPPRPDSAPSS